MRVSLSLFLIISCSSCVLSQVMRPIEIVFPHITSPYYPYPSASMPISTSVPFPYPYSFAAAPSTFAPRSAVVVAAASVPPSLATASDQEEDSEEAESNVQESTPDPDDVFSIETDTSASEVFNVELKKSDASLPVVPSPQPGVTHYEEGRQFGGGGGTLSLGGDQAKLNVLEVLKGMGSAIQLLMRQHQVEGSQGDVRDARSDPPIGSASTSQVATVTKEKYREQAEVLRGEINKRAGQLSKVVAMAIGTLKDKGDVVVRRILENLQTRLDQAKARADKILREPESGELAVRTLHSINQGMNNLASLVQHVLQRVNISIKVDVNDKNSSPPVTISTSPLLSPSEPIIIPTLTTGTISSPVSASSPPVASI